MGVPAHRIVLRHVIPNLASLLIAERHGNVSAAIWPRPRCLYFGFRVVPPRRVARVADRRRRADRALRALDLLVGGRAARQP